MSKDYTPFAISNFRTGFDEAVEPWLLPRDAFQVLRNAHLYRGVIEKIPGYTFFARMSYRKEVQIGALGGGTGAIDGVNKTFTGTLSPIPTTNNITVQSTINAGASQIEEFKDNTGTGILTGSNGGSGTINYVANSPVPAQPAGYITVTFGLAAPVDLTVGAIQYNSILVTYDYLPTLLPIMGIKQFINSNGSQDVLIFDTRRVGKIVTLLGDMADLQLSDYGISELPHEKQTLAITTGFDGIALTYTGTVTAPLVPGEVSFIINSNNTTTATLIGTITDNGDGLLTGALLDPAGSNFINYLTGEWVMTFLVAPLAAYQTNFDGCIYGDIFTGDFTNFFDVVNYQGKAFLTNSIDPPMYYDGTCVMFLNTNLTDKTNTIAPYDLTKVLHVTVNRERLILLSVFAGGIPVLNGAYWSEAGKPLNFKNDEQLLAPTSEVIRTFSIINTDLVVRFSNSERVLRYTGDAFSPFRWDSTNVIWRCDASYSAINYDSWFSSVGRPAIVGSDGVNVKRADEIIPDFTLNLRVDEQQPVLTIDQGSIGQCYGERFDDFKEGWLCYRNYDEDSTTGVKPSNSVLAFSYLDSTYAVYTFPFSCLGFGRIIAEDVWGNNYDLWGEANYTWDSFTQSEGALIDLAGDQNGIVYEIGNGNSITDLAGNSIPCLFEAITKDFNPFVEAGELVRFGFVDFLVSSNDDTKFRVQFYKDNEMDANFDTFYKETTISLIGNGKSKIWKRIYVGTVGQSQTMRIYQNIDDFVDPNLNQIVRIHAIVPYFKAAGRIFN